MHSDMKPFDFEKKSHPVTWDVEGLLPSETLTFFLSKAGVGKSFFVEYMAVCIVYGHKFLGMPVEPCNVLLMDQDTPQDVLDRRLCAFGRYMDSMGYERKCKLYVESMKGYVLSNGSLAKRIREYSNVSLVIIDSLNSVAGKLDVNSTKDMSILPTFKRAVISEGKTLIIIHHISEHSGVTVEEIMTTNDTNKLTMGNSIINQQADTLFFLGSKGKSELTDIFVRPVAKRVKLNVEPFVAHLKEEKKTMHFAWKGLHKDIKNPLFEIDKDILILFKRSPKKRTAIDAFHDMGSKYALYSVRASLKRLVDSGKLIEHKEHPRLFTYEYTW